MDAFDILYNKALRFLSFRPRSEKEVRDNLAKKSRKSKKKTEEVDNTAIDQVISKLKEQNFVNDEEFTRWWIEQRTKFKSKGMRLIKMELKQKGIADEIIQFQISNSNPPAGGQIANEKDRAKIVLKKALRKYHGLSKHELYQKLGSYLARRGFDFDTIKDAVDDVLKEGV